MGYYDTVQVCLNGHIITANYKRSPEFRKKFCPKCGKSTIIQCLSCGAKILGHYNALGAFSPGSMKAPRVYFHNCGKPYPWTESSLKAINELIRLDKQLKEKDKETLKETLPDLLVETPKTQVAVAKFKLVLRKAGKATFEAVKELTIGIVSEAIKKALFPS